MTAAGEIVRRVLIVDDEAPVRNAFARMLKQAGYDTSTAESAAAALEQIQQQAPDVVISDLSMPGESGIDLLNALRRRDLNLPVIFLTGMPTVQTAARAVELGAFRYLTKPVENEDLKTAVDEACRARALARVGAMAGRAQLEESFRRALDALWMAFQPIVSSETRQITGYEALMRSKEPSLPNPLAVLDAAEKLGTLHLLGQRLRALVAETIATAPEGPQFFVNVHVADLADPDLFDPQAPLSAHASRIVLEITERASLEGIADLQDRIAKLRAMKFRIAVDDLGAGYAGLSYFASVQPEVMKIDMSLVRDIDRDAVKQRIVSSLTSLGRELGIEIIGEGVETAAERDKLVSLGCTYLQGYGLGRPGPAFPTIAWT